ncbi:11835_t:CDS:10 [Ambispora leptoticha]|uniref:11835_t:CDS:1 n=1 Tax=Ambispora leptoticha TaxID=144679 RepID=A0A9N9B6K7_9GLOM|nr:11835_t:CDS:10 [Ambispora leptoticha]
MSLRLPFTKLVHHPTKNFLILCFGGHFQAVDTSTGALIATTHSLHSIKTITNAFTIPENRLAEPVNLLPSPKHAINSEEAHTGLIRSIAFNAQGTCMASTDEDKVLKVWELEEKQWKLKNSRSVVKRVVSLAFDQTDAKIIAADKFGDVYRSFPIDLLENNVKGSSQLLLGHVSMVTDMALTPTNKYIITCDRDEHIRVSRYPNSYNIESFCLGHTHFVSKLHIIPWAADFLISGGGDDFVALWDYVHGTLLQTLDIKQFVVIPRQESKSMTVDNERITLDNETTIVDEDKSKLEEEINEEGIAVSAITSSAVSQHIALIIEKFPGIIILRWDQSRFVYHNTLELESDPLDIAYDLFGNLWVSITTSGNDKEKERPTILINLFRKTVNDHEYDKAANDDPLVKEINQYGSMLVDALPDLYPTGQLRKAGTDWRIQRKNQDEDYGDDASNLEGDSASSLSDSIKSKRKKIKTK